MNHFLENSIYVPNRCGWVDCKNVSEPGSGRCIHHINRDKKISPEPYIGMKIRVGDKYVTYHKGHDLVYQAIKKVPGAKDDDGLLLAVVWEDKWDYSKSLRENIIRLPRSENLTRRRRDLHLMGLIEYSPKAMKSREQAFKNERDRVSPLPPDHFLSPESLKKAEEEFDNLIVRTYEQESLL